MVDEGDPRRPGHPTGPGLVVGAAIGRGLPRLPDYHNVIVSDPAGGTRAVELHLGAHYERFVRDLVASGRYASASEVMRDGLRLVEEREQVRAAKLDALRRDIREGLDSGAPEPLDMAAIKAEARRRRAAKGE